MSLIVWRSSSVSGPSVVVATRASAASKPRPASTQMVSWSMTSAASACIVGLALVPHAHHPVVGEEEQQPGGDRARSAAAPTSSSRNAARPASVILIPRMRGRSSPYGCPACTSLTSSPSTSGLGRSRRVRLTQLAHDGGRLAGRCCGLRQSGEEVGAGRRRPGREAPPEDADRADQRHGAEDDCEVHGSVPVVSASQGDRVDDPAHPERAEDHEDPGDDEGDETDAVQSAGRSCPG